jgi:hypothetical protein
MLTSAAVACYAPERLNAETGRVSSATSANPQVARAADSGPDTRKIAELDLREAQVPASPREFPQDLRP